MKQQLSIVKVGGNIIDAPDKLEQFLTNFSRMEGNKILVHGGGTLATSMSAKLGIEAKMVGGRRITDKRTLEVVTMVYGGLINKNIVAKLQIKKCDALGLTGADGGIIPATRRKNKGIDYGYVGDVQEKEIKSGKISQLIQSGFAPVFAPLTLESTGSLLNTNADTIAFSLASAMSGFFEVSLVYCFDKMGVLKNVNEEHSYIPRITYPDYEKYRADSVISAGMLPKMENAFAAIKAGVKKVYICNEKNFDKIHYSTFEGTCVA